MDQLDFFPTIIIWKFRKWDLLANETFRLHERILKFLQLTNDT